MAKINAINNASGSLTIDPGASGDSYLQYNINTTGEFRIGVDDTDDSFRLSQGSALGTNDTFVMSAAGERTMPLQPAFLAYLASSVNNVAGVYSTYFTIGTTTALTEVFDQNGDFNTNGTFTAPITGRYFLCAACKMGEIISTITLGRMKITTSNRNYFLDTLGSYALRNTSNMISLKEETITDMDAADTASFQINLWNSPGNTADLLGQATNPITYVCGCLIV